MSTHLIPTHAEMSATDAVESLIAEAMQAANMAEGLAERVLGPELEVEVSWKLRAACAALQEAMDLLGQAEVAQLRAEVSELVLLAA